MYRRTLLRGAAALPLAAASRPVLAQVAGTPFAADTVREAARALAAKPFQPQETGLPDYLAKLTYDQYRGVRFDKAQAVWRDARLPWQIEFYHRGFIYGGRVDVNEVADGRSTPIAYRPAMFGFGDVRRPTNEDLGFAGFRLHAALNRADYLDEVCSFLGASYFRAVAKGLNYGLSARGLAIKTADRGGEEFPYFKTFWIERPAPGDQPGPITVHALLDSPSAAGSYRFVIAPGAETVFDTQVTLFPRVNLDQVGIAPLTSMFLLDTDNRARVDDWRPAVHDSDGLLMATGHGEVLWRALANPTRLQVSAFQDKSPRGFGLMQRKRAFSDYEDLEAAYEKRPSAWVEPVGDWGEGAVVLVEIPTDKEINDNIVAFWRPKQPLQANVAYGFAYRLHWAAGAPLKDMPAPIVETLAGGGLAASEGGRYFVMNVRGLRPDVNATPDVTSDKGELRNVMATPDAEHGGWRFSFELVPGRETAIELHGRLMADGKPVSETWLYRWTK